MRLRVFVIPVMAAGLLTGCNHGALPGAATRSADPFGYMKASAVCQVAKPQTEADGKMATTMTVRSDDGRCVFSATPPEGGAYASFGVSPAPEHGKAFLYTLDGATQITYTPTMGYAGSDTFTVILIRGPGQKRDQMTVKITADATGVVVPKPAVQAPAPTHPAAKTTTRKRTTTRSHH